MDQTGLYWDASVDYINIYMCVCVYYYQSNARAEVTLPLGYRTIYSRERKSFVKHDKVIIGSNSSICMLNSMNQ